MSKQMKGFALLSPDQRKEMSSKGGKAASKGDCSKRGFASMDVIKRREISSLGGKASEQRRHERQHSE